MKSPNQPGNLPKVQDAIFENAAVVLALIDSEGKVVNINKTGVNMLGKEKSEVLNRVGGEVFNCINAWSAGKLVCGQGRRCESCAVRSSVMSTMQTGDMLYKQEGSLTVNIHDEPIELKLLVTTAIVEIDDTKYVLLTLDDITQLKDQEKELEDSIATKDRFFSIIAHDLRGPLGAVMGLSEIVSENLSSDNVDEYKAYVNSIHKELSSSYKLMDNLLTWSRAQKGEIKAEISSLNLAEVANESIEPLLGIAENKTIEIKNTISPDTYVLGDKNMLETVFRNLISNAIKFTPKGGSIHLKSIKRKGEVRVYVSDSGVGISEERQKGMFDLSTQTTTKGTDKEKGTGLGLMLCKDFVSSMGGEISLESKEGNGTTVMFSIPIER